MFRKISLLLAFGFLLSLSAISQNTNQVPNIQPDTNTTNKNFIIPKESGGSQESPSINKGLAPLENENKMEMELEEAPQKSEPVPGAEILIEQSTNDVNNQAPAIQPTKEEKDKKKKKEKNK
jgi:hypothetical protein